MSQEDLAGRLGVKRQSIANWETNHCYPKAKTIRLMAQVFNVTYDKLYDEIHEGQLKTNPLSSNISVILYDRISAGNIPFSRLDVAGDVHTIIKDKTNLVAVKIHDDAMVQDHLLSGGIAFVRKQGLLEDNQIGLVRINDGEAFFARLQRNNTIVTCKFSSENRTRYPDRSVDLMTDRVDILGRVVGFLGEYR